MSDVLTKDQRRYCMSQIRGKDTTPELLLRKATWAIGLRYRLHRRIGRTKPDMVFIGPKVAVFVDGCFWHRCPLHSVLPKNNRKFWKQKLEQNVQRDLRNTSQLEEAGWEVLRFWEHEIEESAQSCAETIAEAVRHRTRTRET